MIRLLRRWWYCLFLSSASVYADGEMDAAIRFDPLGSRSGWDEHRAWLNNYTALLERKGWPRPYINAYKRGYTDKITEYRKLMAGIKEKYAHPLSEDAT